jgi:hypothetical protein
VERTIKNGWYGGMLPRETLKSSLGNAISWTFWLKIGKLVEKKICNKNFFHVRLFVSLNDLLRSSVSYNSQPMKHNWVPGHFAERHFAERHFAGRTFCRTDSLPKGELAENRDAISSKCLGLCLISELCNSQPLCKITIIWSLAVHNHIDYW